MNYSFNSYYNFRDRYHYRHGRKLMPYTNFVSIGPIVTIHFANEEAEAQKVKLLPEISHLVCDRATIKVLNTDTNSSPASSLFLGSQDDGFR